MRLPAFWLCFGLLAVTGCKSIGPSALKRERIHYSASVAESWREQLLLNILKTRCGDTVSPVLTILTKLKVSA